MRAALLLPAALALSACDGMKMNAIEVAKIDAKAGAGEDAVEFKFPTRAPGMWRHIATFSGTNERKIDKRCFPEAQRIDVALDIPPAGAMEDCSTGSTWRSNSLTVEHHCQAGRQRMDAVTTITGDFETYYLMESKIDLNPEWQGLNYLTITTSAERIGDC